MLAFFSPPVILSVVAVIQLFCTQKLHVFARFLIIYRFSKDVKPKVLNFFEFPVIHKTQLSFRLAAPFCSPDGVILIPHQSLHPDPEPLLLRNPLHPRKE